MLTKSEEELKQVVLTDEEKEKILALFTQQCQVKKLTYATQSFYDFQKDFVITASTILVTIGANLPQEWFMKAMMSLPLIESYSLTFNEKKEDVKKEPES